MSENTGSCHCGRGNEAQLYNAGNGGGLPGVACQECSGSLGAAGFQAWLSLAVLLTVAVLSGWLFYWLCTAAVAMLLGREALGGLRSRRRGVRLRQTFDADPVSTPAQMERPLAPIRS